MPRWEAKTIQQLLPAELPRGGHHLLANLLTYNPSLRLTARSSLHHAHSPYDQGYCSMIPRPN